MSKPGQESEHVFTVSELTRGVKVLLEAKYPVIWLEGEVSNFSRSSAGHLYFTLKDADGQLRCVMWRGRASRLDALPQDGDQVVAHGYVSLYEGSGNVQFCRTVM